MIRETECVGVESCNWALAVADGFLQLTPNLIRLSLEKKRKKKRLAAFITEVFFSLLGPSLLSWIPHVEDQADTVTDGVKSLGLFHSSDSQEDRVHVV